MADIKITLELDSSVYEASLKKVETKTTEVADKTKKNASEMSEAFHKFHEQLEKTHKALDGFAIALAGAGLLEFIKSAMEAGEAAVEMSEQFGITTASMLEINAAASASGVSTEKVAKMMNKMLVGAQEAADGNFKLRDALKEVGTSTDYLRTHSADEAFSKQVHALAEMTDTAKKAETAQLLFGKAATTTNFIQLAEQLDKYKDTQDKYAEAAHGAEQTLLTFNQFVLELKLTVLEALEPMQGFIKAFLESKIAIDAVLLALGGLAIITGIIGLYKAWGMAVLALEIAQKGFNTALAIMDALLSPEIAIIAGVVAALASLYVVYEMITGKVGSFSEGMKKLKDDMGEAATAVVNKLTGALEKNTEAKEKNAKADGKKGQNVLTGKDLNPQAAAEVGLKNQFEQLQLNNKLVVDRLNLETKIAMLSDEQKKTALAQFDAQANYDKEELRIKGEIAKLTAQAANTSGGGGLGGQISILKDQLAVLKSQKDVVGAATAEREKANNVAAMGRFFDEEKLKVNKELLDLQTQMDQMTMTSSEKTLDNIQKQIHAEQELALKKRQGQLGVGESISAEDVEDINKKVADSYQPIIDRTKEVISKSREFNTGWSSAFKQYVDDATNAANQGKAVFDAMTNAMNSAIDNFVTTGKLNFGDFAKSVVMDLEKIALKAAVANVLGASGLGSIFGGGHAMGGSIPAGQFGLVGEQGPELIKGPATVMTNNATKDALGNSTHNTYNINAIDSKSVAQLFAENRMTLFGTVEQARRELPMRTR